MLCLAVPKLPEGPEWQLELKLDGYRGIGIKSNGRAHLASRNGKNFSERFATITRALNRLPDDSVIDGEIVAVNADGVPSFNLLQNGGADHTILFYVFDLLILAGTDLRSRPLEQRRALLCELIPTLWDPIRHSETFEVPVAELLSPRSAARPRRCRREARQQHISTGATAPAIGEDARKPRLGTGYRRLCAQRRHLRFDPVRLPRRQRSAICRAHSERIRLCRATASVQSVPGVAARGMPRATLRKSSRAWKGTLGRRPYKRGCMKRPARLNPQLVASIEFLEWTPENPLRHPNFLALLEDRDASPVYREGSSRFERSVEDRRLKCVKNVFDSVAILGAVVVLAAIFAVAFWCCREFL